MITLFNSVWKCCYARTNTRAPLSIFSRPSRSSRLRLACLALLLDRRGFFATIGSCSFTFKVERIDYNRETLESIFREIVAVEVTPDGLDFDIDSIQANEIRKDNAYGGIRVKLLAYLGTARIPLQIDIGLGDAVYPESEWTEFATLLDFPAPRIRPYPVYSVVSEKFQAMVELGIHNSRMKDYFDMLYLQRHFEFNGTDLQVAIRKTFQRRRTALSTETPEGLDAPFAKSLQKQTQWTAFLRKNNLSIEQHLEKVCAEIAAFVLPAAQPAPLASTWLPNKGWLQ